MRLCKEGGGEECVWRSGEEGGGGGGTNEVLSEEEGTEVGEEEG